MVARWFSALDAAVFSALARPAAIFAERAASRFSSAFSSKVLFLDEAEVYG